MITEFAHLAAQFGLQPVQIVQSGPDRFVGQAQDDRGRRYALKAAAVAGAFAGDVRANRTLSAAGLPVPEVVSYQDGPPAVVVLGWIDGEPLSSSSPAQAQREVGRLLRLVHALPTDGTFSGRPTIRSWIAAWTDEVATWWPSAGGTGQQVQRLRDWFDGLTPRLLDRNGSLTLFDGRADHFLIRAGRVAGVIDLHDVGSGDAAMDLAVVGLNDDRLIPAVLQGYATDSDQMDELSSLIPFYLVLCRLAGAEWHLRVGSKATSGHLLQLAATSLRNST